MHIKGATLIVLITWGNFERSKHSKC